MSASAHATTAATAQAEATNPSVAAEISKFASEEQKVAAQAAQHAQEIGQKLTGKPEGDANVHDTKPSTSIKLDQVYTDEERAAVANKSSTAGSGIAQAATDAYNKPGETLQAAKDTVVDKATTAKDTLAGQATAAKDAATPSQSTNEEGKGIISSVTDTASAAVNTVTAPLGKVAGAVGGMLGFGGANQESSSTETTKN
ncbi:hypothetical protein BKA70DRAFT_1251049 [Coprinopsis sp. MPI-PUGE-AT-0042]|nr:hypothetical protein BKA70DRAFT_1251049 [Coprinopsis sp. MPI-PUGE-AT-0042]